MLIHIDPLLSQAGEVLIVLGMEVVPMIIVKPLFRRFFILFCCLAGIYVLSGCSVYMAATSPKPPDLSVLQPGATRPEVERELGRPITFLRQNNGDIATYQYFGPDEISYGRAAGYAVANLLTVGLAELVAFPVETLQNDKITVEINYCVDGRVRSVKSDYMQAPLERPEKILGLDKIASKLERE